MQVSSRITALLIAVLIFLPRTNLAQQKKTNAEQALFQSANRERAAHGSPPLKWDATLARAAHQHALRMAKQNSLSHQFPAEPDLPVRALQAGARFSALAENVAQGPNAANIHAQWMKSPHHRANLLDTELDSVGIAVTQRHGQLFAVEDFSRAVGSRTISRRRSQ